MQLSLNETGTMSFIMLIAKGKPFTLCFIIAMIFAMVIINTSSVFVYNSLLLPFFIL